MERRKIGIMGGTFNPIHNGHLALAQAAYAYCGLDEVWFMPSGVSYLKAEDKIADGEKRLKMTALAVEEIPYFSCSDMEVRRAGNTYTADTLRQLAEKYPSDSFYFIMGADSLFGLPTWKEPETIAGLCTLAVVVRDDADVRALQAQKELLEQKYAATVVIVPFKKVAISSSDIRERIAKKQDVAELLPEKVLAYINENGLYAEEWYGKA